MTIHHTRSVFQAPAMSSWTLRFEPAEEKRYEEADLVEDIWQARVAFAAASLALFLFLLVESAAGRSFDRTTAVRGFTLLVSGALWLFTYSPSFPRFRVLALGGLSILAVADAIVFGFIVDFGPATFSTGTFELMVLSFWLFTASGIGFRRALIVGLAVTTAWMVFDIAYGAEAGRELALVAGAFAIAAFAGHTIERFKRTDFVRRMHIDFERERSDHLLWNVLPRSIATRLKDGEEPIADTFGGVTVLFADMVGFTHRSNLEGPVRTVSLLNRVFSEFDGLAAEMQVEKIKTIGDAFMAVGGLGHEDVTHCHAVADLALKMMSCVDTLAASGWDGVQFRIGLDSGPAVAGVIGHQKFVYDLWGDTVNRASRMESHGVPGRIQVTEAAYDLLKDRYLCEARGEIEVKGVGPMMTYFLIGPRD